MPGLTPYPLASTMAYKDSSLWRLRQAVGSDLVLVPGAMVAVQRADQRVLLTKRADDGTWCLPAGAEESGGSFARTAIDELAEETGIKVSEHDLIPFGCPQRPRRTRSTTPTAMSLIALPCCSWQRPGGATLHPTGRSRPRPGSSASGRLPNPSILQRRTLSLCSPPTSARVLSRSSQGLGPAGWPRPCVRWTSFRPAQVDQYSGGAYISAIPSRRIATGKAGEM